MTALSLEVIDALEDAQPTGNLNVSYTLKITFKDKTEMEITLVLKVTGQDTIDAEAQTDLIEAIQDAAEGKGYGDDEWDVQGNTISIVLTSPKAPDDDEEEDDYSGLNYVTPGADGGEASAATSDLVNLLVALYADDEGAAKITYNKRDYTWKSGLQNANGGTMASQWAKNDANDTLVGAITGDVEYELKKLKGTEKSLTINIGTLTVTYEKGEFLETNYGSYTIELNLTLVINDLDSELLTTIQEAIKSARDASQDD